MVALTAFGALTELDLERSEDGVSLRELDGIFAASFWTEIAVPVVELHGSLLAKIDGTRLVVAIDNL